MEIKQYAAPVFTLSAQSSVHDTLLIMKTNFVKRIVIVKGKKPIGILTERDISRFLQTTNTKRTLNEIPLSEIMKKNLIMVEKDKADFFHQCATRMVTFKIGSIIIVDEIGDLVGITTQTDITRAFASLYPGRYKVKDYMSERVITCRNTDSLRYTLDILNKNDVSRLVVTDSSGNVQGLITTNAFLKHSEYFRESTKKTQDYLLSKTSTLLASDLMGKEILSVEPYDDLATCADLMIRNNVSGLPVISKDSLVGVLTKFDVVRAFNDVLLHNELWDKYRTYP
jgi:CBS domain-containing protein